MNEQPYWVQITPSVFERILHHARQEAPNECCGLLTGEGRTISHSHPATNILKSEVQYSIDPRELLQFFRELRSSRQSHLGIYHSHPSSEAYPSRTDIEQAFYPHCSYLIVSLKDPAAPSLRAFRIVGEEVTELELQTVS
jgi:proteasome lid subunit RPN8/RPN11